MRPDRRQRRGEGVLEGKRNVGEGKRKQKNKTKNIKTKKGLELSPFLSGKLN